MTADCRLAPSDSGVIDNGAHVSIIVPNNESIDETVAGVDVLSSKDSETAVTRVTVASDKLGDPRLSSLTRQRTPVIAIM